MMSSALTEAETTPAAPRAGADLRAARERLAWPLEDVAAALRIRRPHLEALEEGRIDLLPGNAYAVGFLRTYAKTLGLDPDEVVRRFKAEASEVTRRTELVFPAPMPQRGLPAGAIVLLGVVLAIGAYAGWYRLSGEGRLPAETVAPVPQHLATLADQARPPTVPARQPAKLAGTDSATGKPASPSQAVATSATSAGPTAALMTANNGAAGAPAAAATTDSMAAAMPPGGTPQPPAPPVPAISPTSAAAASLPPPVAMPAASTAADVAVPSGQSQIVLKATADAWVQVRDRNGGGVLLNRILHPGDTWPVPPNQNLVLTTGNAGGTELVVGDMTVQVPGGSGAVRRDLPLDAAAIKDGRFAQLTPPAPPPGAASAQVAGHSGTSRSATQ